MQNNKVTVSEIKMLKYVIYKESRNLKSTVNVEQSYKKLSEYQ